MVLSFSELYRSLLLHLGNGVAALCLQQVQVVTLASMAPILYELVCVAQNQ